MENRRNILFLVGCLFFCLLFGACTKEDVPFFADNADGVYFNYDNPEQLVDSLNFADHILEETDTLTDSLYLKVLGYVSDNDRKIVLKSKPVGNYPEADVILPEVIFRKGSTEQHIPIRIIRPKKMDEKYAVAIYLDTQDPNSQIGEGIQGYEQYTIYVKDSYQNPGAEWGYPAGYYYGDWTVEKYIFLSRLTHNTSFYTYQNFDYGMVSKAVDSLRSYKRSHPDKPIEINLPFVNDYMVNYSKPYYWTSIHDKYLGAYESSKFVSLAVTLNINTTNEDSILAGTERNLVEVNKVEVQSMMQEYNKFYSWGYPCSQYNFKIPVIQNIDYDVIKPMAWDTPLIRKYYGDYSVQKYKFMIRTWLKHQGEANFDLIQLFPVMSSGKEGVIWDDSAGGEASIKACYEAFKNAYEEAPAHTYEFTFPNV